MAQRKADCKRRFCVNEVDPRDMMVTDTHGTGAELFVFGENNTFKADAGTKFAYPAAKNGAEHNYRRLLGTIKRLNTRQTGDALNQQWVLFWCANYLRLIDAARGDEPNAKSMRRQLRKIAPDASDKDVRDAADFACNNEPCEHDARRVGKEIDLRFNRWAAAKFPKSILPLNKTDEQIKKFYRKRENRRSQRRREAAGATPRRLSNVTLAERHGVERRTIARWIKEGKLDPRTGERLDPNVPDSTGDIYCKESLCLGEVSISPVESGTLGEAGPRPGGSDAAPVAPLPDADKRDTETMLQDDPEPVVAAAEHQAQPAPPPSPAFAAAVDCVRESLVAGDGQPSATYLLWYAARHAPAVPNAVMGGDDAGLAAYLTEHGHLTEPELAWIRSDSRPPWGQDRQPRSGPTSDTRHQERGATAAPDPSRRMPGRLQLPAWRDPSDGSVRHADGSTADA